MSAFPELTTHAPGQYSAEPNLSQVTSINTASQMYSSQTTSGTSSSSILTQAERNREVPSSHSNIPSPSPSSMSHGGQQPQFQPQGSPSVVHQPQSGTPTNYHSQSQQSGSRQSTSASNFNALIYGNDVDSVDVATRIAMVCFLF